MRSHEERRCSILGPTQSRISPSILEYTKINTGRDEIIDLAAQLGLEDGIRARNVEEDKRLQHVREHLRPRVEREFIDYKTSMTAY